jgi:hypothetical protein
MDRLCDRRWKVAVITHAEDKRLSEIGRSKLFDTPEERWERQISSFSVFLFPVIAHLRTPSPERLYAAPTARQGLGFWFV